MVFTIEDILARRTPLLFLDAKAAIETDPTVAEMLATHSGKNKQWEKEQLKSFNLLAKGYY